MIGLISPADIISMLNACFGFLALLVISIPFFNQVNAYRWSFTLILLALLADGLDGVLARKIRKGPLGTYLESMADLTSTGIATGFFVFFMYYPLINSKSILILIGFLGMVLFYLFCGLLRLAAFHPLNTKNQYIGLPAPAAAIILLSFSYITISFFYFMIVIFLISILMISSIHYIKPSIPLNVITTVLIFLVFIFDTMFNAVFIWILIFLIFIYILAGPLVVIKKIIKKK